jgi:lysophospholipase L1-like esterase
LLSLGINDWQGGLAVATYQANLQAMVTAWTAHSDVVLISPAPSSIATVPLATQQQYVTAMKNVATASKVPFIDNFNRWGSFELKNPAPYLFYNHPFHPSAAGYSDFAQSTASQLLSGVGH